MIPSTPDGRVLFAIPYQGRTLVGTTDVPVDEAIADPQISEDEIEFLLETARPYLQRRPTRADVLGTFAGLRPLVRGHGSTAGLARDHTVRVDGGLVTIVGGKWTTYRAMASDAVDAAAELAGLPRRRCVTETLAIGSRQSVVGNRWSVPLATRIY